MTLYFTLPGVLDTCWGFCRQWWLKKKLGLWEENDIKMLCHGERRVFWVRVLFFHTLCSVVDFLLTPWHISCHSKEVKSIPKHCTILRHLLCIILHLFFLSFFLDRTICVHFSLVGFGVRGWIIRIYIYVIEWGASIYRLLYFNLCYIVRIRLIYGKLTSTLTPVKFTTSAGGSKPKIDQCTECESGNLLIFRIIE